MLKNKWTESGIEAGCDEAGRGCLCGPVVAAAVILSPGFKNEAINDSKQISAKKRSILEIYIKEHAEDYAVSEVSVEYIDEHNILNASIQAMHLAVEKLKVRPDLILVDGNRFHPYPMIAHQCIIKGDELLLSIAAASILAKNHRDRLLLEMHAEYPQYGWATNMGYATKKHRLALKEFGPTPYHRRSFRLDYED